MEALWEKVDLSESTTICAGVSWRMGFGENERVYVGRRGGGMWSLDTHDSELRLIGGTGTTVTAGRGMRANFKEEKLVGCNSLNAIEVGDDIWCNDFLGDRVLKINRKTSEMEVVIVVHAARRSIDGPFTSARTYSPSSLVPIRAGLCPRMLFLEQSSEFRHVRLIDLASQNVRTLGVVPGVYNIFAPSLLRPDNLIGGSSSSSTSSSGTPRCFTWMNWTDKGTLLVDVNHRGYALLHSSELQPLVTLSPFKTIAVQRTSDNEAWIVLVDWSELPPSLPSLSDVGQIANQQYIISSNRIRRIAQIPGVWNWESAEHFIYLPLANQLIATKESTEPSELIRFSDVLPSTLIPFAPNLSILLKPNPELDDDGSGIPHDIDIIHSYSDTKWNAHSYILKAHKGFESRESIESRLLPAILRTALPHTSIDAFLRYLYFAPIDCTDLDKAFVAIVHSIQLSEQLELATAYLLSELSTRVINELTNESLLSHILTLWFVEQDSSSPTNSTYAATSPLMSMLASRTRSHVSQSEIDTAMAVFEYPKNLSIPHIAQRTSLLTRLISDSSTITLGQPTLSTIGPSMLVVPLEWDDNLDVASLIPPVDPHDYIFCIDGAPRGGVVSKSWLLYPQWKWFERLMKSKFDETRTRHVVLPSWFTKNIILVVLSTAHGTYREHTAKRMLSMAEVLLLYRHAPQWQFDSSACFAPLYALCTSIALASISDSNYLGGLVNFWNAGIDTTDILFQRALSLAYQHRDNITLAQLMALPGALHFAIVIGESRIEGSSDSTLVDDITLASDRFGLKLSK